MPGSEEGGVALGSPGGRAVLLAAVGGSSVAFLDAQVVSVALPTIGRDLDAGLGVLQWTVNAYTLTLAALILLGGALGDRYGRRRVFSLGLVWFALASAGCALAPTAEVLVAARALQGVGGALLTPMSLALLQTVLRREDRARAIGVWSGATTLATIAAPVVGGALVALDWRLVFAINLPVAAAAVWLAQRHVPDTLDPSARGRRLDLLGSRWARSRWGRGRGRSSPAGRWARRPAWWAPRRPPCCSPSPSSCGSAAWPRAAGRRWCRRRCSPTGPSR